MPGNFDTDSVCHRRKQQQQQLSQQEHDGQQQQQQQHTYENLRYGLDFQGQTTLQRLFGHHNQSATMKIYENLCRGCGYGIFDANNGIYCNFCASILNGMQQQQNQHQQHRKCEPLTEAENIYENICRQCAQLYSDGERCGCHRAEAKTETTAEASKVKKEMLVGIEDSQQQKQQQQTSKTRTLGRRLKRSGILQGILGALKREPNNNSNGKRLEIVHHVESFENVFHTQDTFDMQRLCELKKAQVTAAAAETTTTTTTTTAAPSPTPSAILSSTPLTSKNMDVHIYGKLKRPCAIEPHLPLLQCSTPNLNNDKNSSNSNSNNTNNSNSQTSITTALNVSPYESCSEYNKSTTSNHTSLLSLQIQIPTLDSVCEWMTSLRREIHNYHQQSHAWGDGDNNSNNNNNNNIDNDSACDPKSIPPKSIAMRSMFYFSTDSTSTGVGNAKAKATSHLQLSGAATATAVAAADVDFDFNCDGLVEAMTNTKSMSDLTTENNRKKNNNKNKNNALSNKKQMLWHQLNCETLEEASAQMVADFKRNLTAKQQQQKQQSIGYAKVMKSTNHLKTIDKSSSSSDSSSNTSNTGECDWSARNNKCQTNASTTSTSASANKANTSNEKVSPDIDSKRKRNANGNNSGSANYSLPRIPIPRPHGGNGIENNDDDDADGPNHNKNDECSLSVLRRQLSANNSKTTNCLVSSSRSTAITTTSSSVLRRCDGLSVRDDIELFAEVLKYFEILLKQQKQQQYQQYYEGEGGATTINAQVSPTTTTTASTKANTINTRSRSSLEHTEEHSDEQAFARYNWKTCKELDGFEELEEGEDKHKDDEQIINGANSGRSSAPKTSLNPTTITTATAFVTKAKTVSTPVLIYNNNNDNNNSNSNNKHIEEYRTNSVHVHDLKPYVKLIQQQLLSVSLNCVIIYYNRSLSIFLRRVYRNSHSHYRNAKVDGNRKIRSDAVNSEHKELKYFNLLRTKFQRFHDRFFNEITINKCDYQEHKATQPKRIALRAPTIGRANHNNSSIKSKTVPERGASGVGVVITTKSIPASTSSTACQSVYNQSIEKQQKPKQMSSLFNELRVCAESESNLNCDNIQENTDPNETNMKPTVIPRSTKNADSSAVSTAGEEKAIAKTKTTDDIGQQQHISKSQALSGNETKEQKSMTTPVRAHIEENVYQTIWECKTVGEAQKCTSTPTDNCQHQIQHQQQQHHHHCMDDGDSLSLTPSILISSDAQDQHEWETDDDFQFSRSLLSCGSSIGSTNTLESANSFGGASLMHPILSNIGIFFSLTEPKLRAIKYDYDRVHANAYFAKRLQKIQVNNSCTDFSSDSSIESNLFKTPTSAYTPISGNSISYTNNNTITITTTTITVDNNNDRCKISPTSNNRALLNETEKVTMTTTSTTETTKPTMDSEKSGVEHEHERMNVTVDVKKLTTNSGLKTDTIFASVAAWQSMLLSVTYIEDEEDMYVSELEILRAQIFVQRDYEPLAERIRKIKSTSLANLTDAPDDKKSIAGRVFNKIWKVNRNVRSPKSEKKIKRQVASTSLYLDDGIQLKYPIFNTSLKNMELDFISQPNVPRLVLDCVKYIEDQIMQEGVYRASGNKTVIDELKQKLSDGDCYEGKLLQNQDVHTLTGLLKLFFRELSEPLIVHEVYACLGPPNNSEEALNRISKALQSLCEPNLSTLKFIIQHLTKVAAQSATNRMTASNLAIVWGPCIFAANQTSQIGFNIPYMNSYARILIEHFARIFPTNERLVD